MSAETSLNASLRELPLLRINYFDIENLLDRKTDIFFSVTIDFLNFPQKCKCEKCKFIRQMRICQKKPAMGFNIHTYILRVIEIHL